MASLQQRGNTYHIAFRFDGRQISRSLKTSDRDEADHRLNCVQRLLYRLETGQEEVPQGVDVIDFILSDGRAKRQTVLAEEADPLPFGEGAERYLVSRKGRDAISYIDSQRTHLRHLQSYLNEVYPSTVYCRDIGYTVLKRFQDHRLLIRDPSTVQRERNSLRNFFAWCLSENVTKTSPAIHLEAITSGRDLDPFRTKGEILEIIERGGLTYEELRAYWESLYLRLSEVGEAINVARHQGDHDHCYLLHAIPAYTGMRRGEVLRLKWPDILGGYLIARSRKQSRSKKETMRRIDLHPELQRILTDWKSRSSSGQFVICDADGGPIGVDVANRRFWKPLRGSEWCLDSKRNHFCIGFHTYRHSFASNMAARGVDQRIIDGYMGHTTEAMRRRYRHLFPESRQHAIRQLNFFGKGIEPRLDI
ncbi:MAG: tyrosine-type recombinase/integrase [Pirellulaceae bacterium]